MRRIRNNIDLDEQEVGRWLISYADFITLLFAFFVVLYSISQVNASKYKILSQSLEGIFDTPLSSNDPVPVGEPSLSLTPKTGDDIEQPELDSSVDESAKIDSENFATSEEFKDLEKGLQASLGDLVDQDLAEINSDANWINIVLKSALLFPSGSDSLNLESDPLMEEVAKHLNTNLQLILVHGHTDNIPISTEKFPSNWELSSARGVAVVRKLQNFNVQPNRLSVEGHGEYQPIADNSTIEGRRENRRVVISISRKQQAVALNDNNQPIVDNGSNGPSAAQQTQKEQEPEYDIIRLPGGGILIRGKESPETDTEQQTDADTQNNQ
jgi:chemotaxis protein MotB